ncbi:hypothetical protein CAEBREN_06334 [Caenorhabditis brenneri]|uniref:Homeobox domain-containing protein n=1 Tax=Caenorhabditis brenneri TaxID=135651 RepID=G0NQW7_CAEBE|nr:hypothetical protein CAEBREN_06334 [Caenorhabditis brenneri]
MTQSPAHDMPDNSPPNGACPSEQSSAPVGPDAPERSADGNLDLAAKNGDIPSAAQSKPSGASLSVGNRQVLVSVDPAAPLGSSPPGANAPISSKTSTRTTEDQPEAKRQNIPVHSAPAGTQPSTSKNRERRPTQNRQRAATDCDGTGSCTYKDCMETVEVFASGPGERVKMTRSGRPTGDQSNETATSAAKKARVPKRDFSHGLPPGSDDFMKIFILLEKTLYSGNNTFKVHVFENGYEIDLGNFKDVYKFKNKEGLKMKAPLDFAWETITKYISPGTVLGINYSNGKIGKQLDDIKLGEYLDLFKISEELRKVIINSITLEFSGTECTEHEESLLPKRGEINTSHLFEGFRNGMWGYLEYCLLPCLKQYNDQESVELGKIFAEGCNPEARCLEKHIWYTKEEKKALLSELKTCLGVADCDHPSTSAASNPGKKAPRKQRQMRREEGEVAEEEAEEASTSAASDSDSKRKLKALSKRTMKRNEEESLEDIKETGSEATAQTESSSTTLPSNLRNLERKQAVSRRPAKPSTSADANSGRKRNESNDPVEAGQEGEVPRKMKTSSHSSTFPLASTADRQNREVPRTTSKLNEKEPGSVEDEDPASVHNYPDLDDYDTGSYGQQTMDSIPVDNEMEVVGEETDTILREENESTSLVNPSGSSSPARTNRKDNNAGTRLSKMLASIPESNARKNANSEDLPTSTAADSEKVKSHPADSTNTSSFSYLLPNDTATSASNCLPILQQDETEIIKTPETEQEKLLPIFADPKMTEPKPNIGSIEEVQVVQENMREKQETTPSDEPDQSLSTLGTSPNSVISVIESKLVRRSNTQKEVANAMKTTPSDESILPTSSSKVPEQQAAAPTTPYSLPHVPTTVHLADMQNMPTSSKLLPQQELSDIALLPKEQSAQPRELLISLLKEKRQALSAIVMQELDDTQLMQLATLLHLLPVSASITEGIHKSDDISEAGRMVSGNEKPVSEQARAEKDQLENGEMAADNNEEAVDPEKKKQPTGSVTSDPAEKKKDQVEQEEDSARKNDAALRRNALYNHFLLLKKIDSLPSTEQEEVCRLMSSQMMVVESFVSKVQEAVSPSATVKNVADVLDQHRLLINGIESLTGARRARAYKALALQMATVQELVEDKQEQSREEATVEAAMEDEVEEKNKKRTADGEQSTSLREFAGKFVPPAPKQPKEFTEEQRQVLLDAFQQSEYIDTEGAQELSRITDLTTKQVINWFCNQRREVDGNGDFERVKRPLIKKERRARGLMRAYPFSTEVLKFLEEEYKKVEQLTEAQGKPARILYDMLVGMTGLDK